MPSVAKAILPSPRRPVQKDRATAIERYNLEQMCWRVFWTTTQDITELTNILNNNLAQKETALKKNKHLHPNQYLSRLVEADIVAFLEKYKRKISNVIGHREHKMMEQTIDIVERIQQTAVGVMDTMDLWKEMLMHARGKDDLKEMMLTNRMLASERRQLIEYLEKLAELTGKVKTHISVDVLQENMQIVCKIIQQADLLNETQKLGLLNQVQQSVTLTMSKSIDDQGV
jgi:hypothetical protein